MKDTLKSLELLRKNIVSQITNIKLEISGKNKELTLKEKELKIIEDKIANLNLVNPVISEHAYLRYFERVLGYDLEEISKIILSEKVINLKDKLGNSGEYPNENGFKVVFKDNRVTTILKN